MIHRLSVFFSFLFFLNFCASSKSHQNPEAETKLEKYKQVAEAKFAHNIRYSMNKDKSCVLCIHQTKLPADPGQSKLSFLLYDLKSEEVIYEASHPNATVKWISEDKIQVSLTPGVVSGNEGLQKSNTGYVYDTKLKKKISQNLPARK